MEDFESPSIESGNWPSSWSEKTREQSEKQKESYKKAQTQIQRSQKDEKKAKGDNDSLFTILERFIQNPYYEDLVPVITNLLQRSVPSRYILVIIGLLYPEATIYMLTAIGKHQDIQLLLSIHRETEPKEFNESSLHPTIRTWMSTWVQSWQVFIMQDTMSIILKNKLLTLLEQDVFLIDALSDTLAFFFASRNIHASKRITHSYAQHITSEYIVALKRSIDLWDKDLLLDITIDHDALFWLAPEADGRA